MAAPKKKEAKDLSSLTYEEVVKAIKSMSKSTTFIGDTEITEICSIPKIPIGIPTLDFGLGGGITKGRVTILAGNPSAGKSTLTLQILAKLIDDIKESGQNKFVLVYDVEGSWESKYAKALGVDQKYVMIKRTSVIEDAFKEIDDYISMGFIAALVIDSLDSMTARKQDDNAYQATMGGTAGALAAHLPNLYGKIIDHEVTTIIIKQARVKLGGYSPQGAEIITFSGGKALRHYSDTIIIMKRMSNRNLTYTPIQVKFEKTRSSRMGLTLDLPLSECGVDPVRDLFSLAKIHGLINVAGAGWITYSDFKIQGEEAFVEKVRSEKQLYETLKKQVYEELINTTGQTSLVYEGEELVTDLGDD